MSAILAGCGEAFCANLLAEANKVADIREILAKDKTE